MASHPLQHSPREQGFTLIEAIFGVAIIAIVFTSLVVLFNAGIRSVNQSKARTLATSVAQRQMETIRNMPYDDIGTAGGWPAGTLAQSVAITEGGAKFTMLTTVIYVDDPFDRLVTTPGTPDQFPWDYKKVQIEMLSPSFTGVAPVLLTSQFAPKGVESQESRGTLLVHVINANGDPVPSTLVQLTNSNVAPAVNAGQLTDVDGNVFFYALKPDVQRYHAVATKAGYSSAQTYTTNLNQGSPTYNPNPSPADATIVVGQVTELTFAIDLLSTLQISTVQAPLSNEWKVNTDGGTDDQIDPVLTVTNGTNVAFSWNDHRNNKWNTYAQKADASTHDPLWIPDVQIDPAANQTSPAIAHDSTGKIFVAWSDTRNGNQDVYLEKHGTDGTDLWGGPKKVSTTAESADQTEPAVAADSTDGCRIVWRDARTDNGDIYLHRCDAAGNYTFPANVRVDDAPVNTAQSDPDIVRVANAGDEFYISWQDARADAGNIHLQRVNAHGVALWPTSTRVNVGGNGTLQNEAQLSVLSTGEAVVVWTDARNGVTDLYLQKINADGTRAFPNDMLVGHAPTGSAQTAPDVAITPNGRIVVTWLDTRNGNPDIYATVLNADGTPSWTKDVLLNTDTAHADQAHPNVSTLADGTIVFAWADKRDGDWNIYAATYSDATPTTIVPNVALRIRGAKTIGSAPNSTPPPDATSIYKYQQNVQTNANGVLTLPNIEWDAYTIDVLAPKTLKQSTPPQPVTLTPSTTLSVELNVE